MALVGRDNIIRAEEPPARKVGRQESERSKNIAASLRRMPDKWALVSEGERNDSLAVRIRKGQSPSFRAGVFEASSRKQEDGTFNIYARFISKPVVEVKDTKPKAKPRTKAKAK